MASFDVRMSIVFPRKKVVRNDIFAPRKSIMDAKEKLGPAYFDLSLLECSRNAIELNKLVNAWEDIDKARAKLLKNLDREQRQLLRTLKRNKPHCSKDDPENDFEASDEGIETLDGKPVPPGFRFKANGELKHSSQSSLPLNILEDESESDSEQEDTETDENGTTTTKSLDKNPDRKSSKAGYSYVDYRKEIQDLEIVLDSIARELARNQISLSKTSSGRTFLRSHSKDHVSINEFLNQEEQKSPNARFAFKPGTSSKEPLHKKTVKTPSHRNCTGCMFKLKQESDDIARIIKNRETKLSLKKTWSYVPQGRYVQSSAMPDFRSDLGSSSTVLKSNTNIPSSTAAPSASSKSLYKRSVFSANAILVDSGKTPKSPKPSVVHFQKIEKDDKNGKTRPYATSSVHLDTRAKSSPALFRARSALDSTTSLSPARVDEARASTVASTSADVRPVVSCVSRFGGSRPSSRSLQNFEARMRLLKACQVST